MRIPDSIVVWIVAPWIGVGLYAAIGLIGPIILTVGAVLGCLPFVSGWNND